MTDIAPLRRRALSARRALSPGERALASQWACQRLSRLPRLRRAARIGIYWPLASEADPRWLIPWLGPHVRFFYPRVDGQRVVFIHAADPLERRGWAQSPLGVYEPPGPMFPLDQLDALILPLAGFDGDGHRIGLGGGFYDRTLAPLARRRYRRPHCYGLAFEAQRLPVFSPAPWDIAPDAIVSERGVYRRGSASTTER